MRYVPKFKAVVGTFAFICATLFGQSPATTRILDVVYNLDGKPFTGTLVAQLRCIVKAGQLAYANTPIRVCIGRGPSGDERCDYSSTNPGEIDFTLVPNAPGSGLSPSNCTKYEARFTPNVGGSWLEYWTVPVSSTPVRRGSISSTTGNTPQAQPTSGDGLVFSQQDGCARIVSGRLQSFTGPNCSVPQNPPYEQNCSVTFTNTVNWTVPAPACGYQTTDLVVSCYSVLGASMPCPEGGPNPVSFDYVASYAVPVSGTMVIGGRSGNVPNQGYTFLNATNINIPQSQHGFNHVRFTFTCYGTTLVSGVYPVIPCFPVVNPNTRDISISFAVPTNVRVVLMAK